VLKCCWLGDRKAIPDKKFGNLSPAVISWNSCRKRTKRD